MKTVTLCKHCIFDRACFQSLRLLLHVFTPFCVVLHTFLELTYSDGDSGVSFVRWLGCTCGGVVLGRGLDVLVVSVEGGCGVGIGVFEPLSLIL